MTEPEKADQNAPRSRITGSGNLQAPSPQLGPQVVSPTGLIRVSKDYLDAFALFGPPETRPQRWVNPGVTLAGHAVEAALKAWLAGAGWTDAKLKKIAGHDLKCAWEEARNHGLSVDATIPDWLEKLSSAFGAPYLARYPRDNTGIVIPNAPTLLAEVRSLVATVEQALRDRGVTT